MRGALLFLCEGELSQADAWLFGLESVGNGALVDRNGNLVDRGQELVDRNGNLVDRGQELVDRKRKLIDRRTELVDRPQKSVDGPLPCS